MLFMSRALEQNHLYFLSCEPSLPLGANIFFSFLDNIFIFNFYLFIFSCIFPLSFICTVPSSPSTHPSLPSNHHTVVHIHEFFLSFFPSIPLPASIPSPRVISLLSIYESVSILLISSVCLLDSTYEGNHMVFVFL